jgi:hypothetical protein
MKDRVSRTVVPALFVVAGAVIFWDMYRSQTPPAHADHDHAMASLDAGGFLWVERADGGQRNLVGRPGKVLVLHWFDPAASSGEEQAAAAAYARSVADDPGIEVALIAVAGSWRDLSSWADAAGIPRSLLYLDTGRRTGEIMGVRRLPETVVYDPAGNLAHQTRGATEWSDRGLRARIEAARAGVDEIG